MRQAQLIAVVEAFLVGCALLLVVVGCAGVRSKASQEEQERTEATEQEQARSPEATASEDDRCSGTRSFHRKNYLGTWVTNDLPGCPKGGLLSGTDGQDTLAGMDGDDDIRGLGDQDGLFGGPGNDVLVGGPNHEEGRYKGMDVLWGGPGSDVLHGGAGTDNLYSYSLNGGGLQGQDVLYGEDGNDLVQADDHDKQDKLYCGKGWDKYLADEGDFVSSSCEKKWNRIVY